MRSTSWLFWTVGLVHNNKNNIYIYIYPINIYIYIY